MEESSIIVVEFQMARTDEPDADIIKSRSKLPLKLEFSRFFLSFLTSITTETQVRRFSFWMKPSNHMVGIFMLNPNGIRHQVYQS